MRQLILLQSAMACYYKVRELYYYKVRQVLLQSVTILFQSVTEHGSVWTVQSGSDKVMEPLMHNKLYKIPVAGSKLSVLLIICLLTEAKRTQEKILDGCFQRSWRNN